MIIFVIRPIIIERGLNYRLNRKLQLNQILFLHT